MKELTELRAELDAIDRELVTLFQRRMETARDVARYKIAHGLPVLDSSREDAVLASREAMTPDPEVRRYIRPLFIEIMALSRSEQEAVIQEEQNK